MPRSALTGTRIRDRRLYLGVKQAELAASVEISPSYLNLIEHNRRNIGGKLLLRLAERLSVDPQTLSQGGEDGVFEALRDAVGANGQPVSASRIDDLMSRFPEWASLISDQSRKIKSLEQVISGLNDRLTHDPVLSEKMHEILAAVSAIRSTSSILVATPELDADWRARFHGNIDAESRRLAETSAAMATHFDMLTRAETSYVTPLDATLSMLDGARYHFPEIERLGAAVIPDIIRRAGLLDDPVSKQMLETALDRYSDEAALIPLEPFSEAAEACQFEPSALATQFHVGLDVVFRRLASLELTPNRPEIGLVACDTSGAIVFRKTPAGFDLPRFGVACPLWPVFSALRAPSTAIRQLIEAPGGERYRCYAFAEPVGTMRFDLPSMHVSWMLLIEDQAMQEAALPLGSSCRICPRDDCMARREPSILTGLVETG